MWQSVFGQVVNGSHVVTCGSRCCGQVVNGSHVVTCGSRCCGQVVNGNHRSTILFVCVNLFGRWIEVIWWGARSYWVFWM